MDCRSTELRLKQSRGFYLAVQSAKNAWTGLGDFPGWLTSDVPERLSRMHFDKELPKAWAAFRQVRNRGNLMFGNREPEQGQKT